MSLDIRFQGDQQVIASIKDMGPRVAAAAKDSISRGAFRVLALSKQKVSGEVLKNRTGTLRRALNARITANEWQIVGTVGIKLTYAAAHEFGIHKTVNVPAHLRMQTMAWGKKLREPHQVVVRTHPMKMNLPERSFLRSSLKELRGDIVADFRTSVNRAAGK